jgi:cytochrome c biogenesis protein CcmG/thiol:disulfide interchange protein DsbE
VEATSPSLGRRRPWVKAALILLPAVALIAVLGWATFQEGEALTTGDDAPAFTAARLGQQGSLSLSDLEGKPVVLNFWASWCVPCEDEAPILNEAHRRYGDDVAFVGVNIKDAKSHALEFEQRFDVPYPSIRDETGEIYSDYGLTGQPETFLLDGQGTIVEHIPGAIASRDALFQMLERLVARDG